jgi:hypothetical protein
MNRIRRDDVELFLRRLQEVPGIVEHQMRLGIVEDVMVFITEIEPRAFRDPRFDLADHKALDFWMDR